MCAVTAFYGGFPAGQQCYIGYEGGCYSPGQYSITAYIGGDPDQGYFVSNGNCGAFTWCDDIGSTDLNLSVIAGPDRATTTLGDEDEKVIWGHDEKHVFGVQQLFTFSDLFSTGSEYFTTTQFQAQVTTPPSYHERPFWTFRE